MLINILEEIKDEIRSYSDNCFAYGLIVGGLDSATDIVLRGAAIFVYPVIMGCWITAWLVLAAVVIERGHDFPVSDEAMIICGLVVGIGTYFFIIGPFVVEPFLELIVF